MQPLYTLLLCLPAALALIACACGVAVLWPLGPGPPSTPLMAGGVAERAPDEAQRTCNHRAMQTVVSPLDKTYDEEAVESKTDQCPVRATHRLLVRDRKRSAMDAGHTPLYPTTLGESTATVGHLSRSTFTPKEGTSSLIAAPHWRKG
jgi:hypothetical protein